MKTFIPLALIALAFAGCPPPEEPEVPAFSMLIENIEGGALLGAHSDGDDAILVGGDVDGGRGIILHYDGDTLCREPAVDRTVWWVDGITEGEWYAVGDSGLILHQTSEGRVDESVDTEATLYGVYVTEERVFAVGGDLRGTGLGEVWAKDGDTWTKIADAPEVLFKVWENWVVGQNVAYTLAGDVLSAESPDLVNESDLLTVVGRSDDDVYAVGGDGGAVMHRYDGQSWSVVDVDPICSFQPLNGVYTAPEEDVYIAGFFGAMARFDGSEWECPEERLTQADFHVAHKHKDEVLFGGGNLFTQSNNVGALGRYAPGSEAKSLEVVDCP